MNYGLFHKLSKMHFSEARFLHQILLYQIRLLFEFVIQKVQITALETDFWYKLTLEISVCVLGIQSDYIVDEKQVLNGSIYAKNTIKFNKCTSIIIPTLYQPLFFHPTTTILICVRSHGGIMSHKIDFYCTAQFVHCKSLQYIKYKS